MIKILNRHTLAFQAAVLTALMIGEAHAAGGTTNNFSSIGRNITESIEELPGLISGLAYMMGLLLGVVGVLKIKDHVENPSQTPLKDGAIRLAAGGALFAIPIVTEAMLNTIGTTSTSIGPSVLPRVQFQVN